jgi:phosphatidylglycerol:prolipoprotein diacylglycerol transferase
MLLYPKINPIALSIGPLKIHWYGIMYLIGFILAWFIANYRVKRLKLDWTRVQIEDLIFYAALGIILGGRIGYMFFYNFSTWVAHPLEIFKIWEGGMSFHGGLIGVIVALTLFAKRFKKDFLVVADFTAPLVPLGLAAGRIGNFINGELWGRPSDAPWAMVFPQADYLARHPSQLYEFAFEGLILFGILFFYSLKPHKKGQIMAMFLLVYGVMRFSLEYFREPDNQLGFIMDTLTMGQLLSIPMIIAGLIIWTYQEYHAKLSSIH